MKKLHFVKPPPFGACNFQIIPKNICPFLVLVYFLFGLFNPTFGQSYPCGVYDKTRPDTLPEQYLTDRFGNIFSEEELTGMYQGASLLACSNTGPFNLIIEPTTYQGNAFPTVDQETIICKVFEYLASEITAPGNGGTVNIFIIFDPSLGGSGAAGLGSPLFNQQCGIGFSAVQEQLNTESPNLPLDYIHGYLMLNPSLDWYTEEDEDPPIDIDEIDLYTVVLHEALHVLGFSSHVGATGDPIDGFYTNFDLGLENGTGNEAIVPTTGSGDCCKEYEFNTAVFPNMPDDILQCGDVFYDVAQTPPVHADYGFPSPLSDGQVANVLSHLSIICGSDDYVMHGFIGTGSVNPFDGTPNIRRVLTPSEKEILCEIGYDVGTSCSAGCLLIVRDDGPFLLHQPNEVLQFGQLTMNDFDASGNYQITFDFTCGDIGNMVITVDNQTEELSIVLNGTPNGQYSFCYTITSCNGDLCGIGEVVLIVADEVDPSTCPVNDCNLVGYGDFESFPVAGSIYYPSFAAPWSSEVIIVDPVSPSGPFANTPDIFSDGNNQFVHFAECDECDNENLLTPLCTEIPVGCGATIEFDACATSFPQIKTLGVWALSQLPSGLSLPSTVACDDALVDNSGITIGTCLGEFDLQFGGVLFPFSSPPNFTHYSIPLPGGLLNHPIKYLWFWGYDDFGSYLVQTLIDNVEATTDCQNKITLASNVVEACIGEQATVEIEVCLTGPINAPADVTIEPELQGIPGITLSNNNPDFPNGTATVGPLDPGDCFPVTLFLDISGAYLPGTEISIPLNVGVTGACIEDADEQSIDLELENCNCDCPPGSLNVGLPGTEVLLSKLVSENELPSMPVDPINLVIHGTLIIDADVFTGNPGKYTFPIGSQVCMAPGAAIKIPMLNELKVFDGSHIKGCDQRWDGIILDGLRATLTLSGTTEGILIEDAQYAVHPIGGDERIVIENTVFDKNYVGLYTDGTNLNDFASILSDATFDCTSNLLPHFDPLDPNDGTLSYAGIHTIGQDVLNVGTGGNILFQNLRNGIITENCELTVRGAEFRDLQRGGGHAISGTGIHASGDGEILNVAGAAGAPPATFTNCTKGIEAQGVDAIIAFAQMTNVSFGIVASEGADRHLDFSDNNIIASGIGIWLRGTDPASLIEIDNNDILVDINLAQKLPPVTGGIVVEENGLPQANSTIQYNNVDIVDAKVGIGLENSEGPTVSCNFISALSPDFSGILLDNSPNLQILSNSVSEQSNSIGGTPVSAGIRVNASTGVSYSCNSVTSTGIGVQFDMMCGDTEFKTTRFSGNTWGLHYLFNASTGQQPGVMSGNPAHGNHWFGDWNLVTGAKHDNTGLFAILGNQYTVPDPNNEPYSQPPNPDPANDWFVVDNNINEEKCFILLCKETWQFRPNTELDESIADGTYSVGGDHDVPMRWMAEKFLYEKLSDNPSLLTPGSVYESFYNGLDGSVLSNLVGLKQSIEGLFDMDEATSVQLSNLYSQRVSALDSIRALDSLLLTATGTEAELLESDRKVQIDTLASLSASNRVLSMSIKDDRRVQADGIIAQNAAITAVEGYELNEKTVNDLFLKSVVKGIALDTPQVAILESIASQCPYAGGTAVYRARALLAGITETVFDDEAACVPQGQQLIVQPDGAINIDTPSTFRVFPNPSNGNFTLEGLGEVEGTKMVKLLDINGRSVLEMEIGAQEPKTTVQAGHLPPGIYMLKVTRAGTELYSEKLILQ